MLTYRITGNGNPSPNGDYPHAGVYNGRPYYEPQDASFKIWWGAPVSAWTMSANLGIYAPGYWSCVTIEGSYSPGGSYTGNPAVVLCPVSRYIAKPPIGSLVNWGHPLAHGLVALWPFWEGAGPMVHDVANKHEGALGNMDPDTDWVGGLRGPALEFDGFGSYVGLFSPFVFASGEPWTVSLWAKAPREDYQGFWGNRSVLGQYARLMGRATGRIDLYNDANVSVLWMGMPNDVWFLCTVAYDGAKASFYINKALVSAQTLPGEFTIRKLCSYGKSGPAEETYHGLADAAAVWNRAVSANEVAILYSDFFAVLRRPSKIRGA